MRDIPIEDLIEYVVSLIRVEPLTVYEDRKVQENEEIKMKIHAIDKYKRVIPNREPRIAPGMRVTVSLPFSGDPRLWELEANIATSPDPYGIIKKEGEGAGILDIVFDHPMDKPISQLEKDIIRNLDVIKSHLAQQKKALINLITACPRVQEI
jgi:hypothetical protein